MPKDRTGLVLRHSRGCPTSGDRSARCKCTPAVQARVYDARTGRTLTKSFAGAAALTAAKHWRNDRLSESQNGKLALPTAKTLRQAAGDWIADVEAGKTGSRSGHGYKASTLRQYKRDLDHYLLPDLGHKKLSDIQRRDVQAIVDHLRGEGLSASKVRNAIIPLRVIFKRALRADEVKHNPTEYLDLPAGSGERNRVASLKEFKELLEALPLISFPVVKGKPSTAGAREIYALAGYAGLRRGEIRGLRWSDVDLASGTIAIQRSWDDVVGETTPKSLKATRPIFITPVLRELLADLKARSGRSGSDLVFGRTGTLPFTATHIRNCAHKAWDAENARRLEEDENAKLLQSIELHELRHTFVTHATLAGNSLLEVGDLVGHTGAYVTERYRHLLPSQLDKQAKLFAKHLSGEEKA